MATKFYTFVIAINDSSSFMDSYEATSAHDAYRLLLADLDINLRESTVAVFAVIEGDSPLHDCRDQLGDVFRNTDIEA